MKISECRCDDVFICAIYRLKEDDYESNILMSGGIYSCDSCNKKIGIREEYQEINIKCDICGGYKTNIFCFECDEGGAYFYSSGE